MPEVSQEELNILTGAYTLLSKLHGDVKTRGQFEGLVKQVNPQAVTSHDIAAPHLKPIQDELAELKKWRADREKRDRETDQDGKLAAAFDKLRREDGLTDEGEKTVKKLMVDRNIPDPEAAFALFQRQSPPPTPIDGMHSNGMPGRRWGDIEAAQASDALLFADPDRWATDTASKVLTEMRAGRAG